MACTAAPVNEFKAPCDCRMSDAVFNNQLLVQKNRWCRSASTSETLLVQKRQVQVKCCQRTCRSRSESKSQATSVPAQRLQPEKHTAATCCTLWRIPGWRRTACNKLCNLMPHPTTDTFHSGGRGLRLASEKHEPATDDRGWSQVQSFYEKLPDANCLTR